MKQNLKFILFAFLICSCSDSEGGDSSEPAENTPPTIPTLINPSNNLLCLNNVLQFSWNKSADAEGHKITYRIEISTNTQFQFNGTTQYHLGLSTNHTFNLEKGRAYYWRVKAMDSKEASSNYSPVYNLYTEGESISNHLPFAPELVTPILDSSEDPGDIILEWTCNDIDGDALNYDVYFDTNNPPTSLISENQSESIFNVSTVSATNYYWKIVVKDENGGQSIGQVWSFNTN